MSAYIKKIAVIKQIKGGFSADGGNITGLVKAETYAGFLKVEVSLINIAPLTEGRYVFGISDGLNTAVFEGLNFECEMPFSLASGFAFLVCFCMGGASPVASAACGQMACALPDLKEEMAKRENTRPKDGKGNGAAYDDEAIAEVNYYESSYESGAAVCAPAPQEEKRSAGGKDAQAARSVKGEKNVGLKQADAVESDIKAEERTVENAAAPVQDKAGKQDKPATPTATAGKTAKSGKSGKGGTTGGLAGGDFYSRMEKDIKKIFATYPREAACEAAMEGSKFAKIAYGEGKYYVFGVLTVEGKPRYICYGVPAENGETPPPSLKDMASYVSTASGGYWMTYQDAATGVSIKISFS